MDSQKIKEIAKACNCSESMQIRTALLQLAASESKLGNYEKAKLLKEASMIIPDPVMKEKERGRWFSVPFRFKINRK